ncbi:MAG: hypothetical protein QXU82_00485 [Candidatus Aenigmatarchaeota archaeon]
MVKEMQPETVKKIARVLTLLKTAGTEIHLRGIAKNLGMDPKTVSRIVDNYLAPFVDSRNIELYGFRARLVKLKDDKRGVTLKDILNYAEVRKKIRQPA